VAGGGYGDFVTARAGSAPQAASGDIVDEEGRVLGRHRGVVHYTVGQRRGLGISGGDPLYVVRVDAPANRVVVGREDDLLTREVAVREIHWIAGAPPEDPEVQVRYRYRSSLAPARMEPGAGNLMRLRFHEPQRAVAAGQSAVFYRGERVLGGGVIGAPRDRALPSLDN